jgi:HEPN domain-containing protein
MPPNDPAVEAAQAWIRFARADLHMARGPAGEDDLYELLCFHAQQAAEKALKAILVRRGVEFPFTHDLGVIVALLPSDLSPPEWLAEAVQLTIFAAATRYPLLGMNVTEEHHARALHIAERVVSWALATMPAAE